MCRNGFVDGVKLIVRHVKHVAQTDPCGRDAMFFACESSNFCPELISVLIESGFTVENAVDLGPCFHTLCKRGEKSILHELVACVNDENDKMKLSRFVSHILSCMNENIHDLATMPLKDPIFYRDEQMTRLNYLCGRGMESAVREILRKMRVTNELDVTGMSAIHYACRCRTINVSLIQLLIANGADVNLPDGDGMTALHHLCLARSVEGVSAVIRTVRDVDRGCTQRKITPLQCICMTALKRDDVGIIELLLDHKANPTTVNAIGLNALDYMCVRGIREGVELILSRVDKSVPDRYMVLQKDINDIFIRGESVLHLACRTSAANLDIVKILVEFGADVNAADSLGNTPLHYCCQDPSSISWIIRREVFHELEDIPQKTEQIRYDIAKYLIAMGAHIHVRNKDGVESFHGKFRGQLGHEMMKLKP